MKTTIETPTLLYCLNCEKVVACDTTKSCSDCMEENNLQCEGVRKWNMQNEIEYVICSTCFFFLKWLIFEEPKDELKETKQRRRAA